MTKKQEPEQKKPERIQLTVDYAFKRVFGKNGNESMLKDLLESILEIEIKEITIQNPEIPKNIKNGKVGTLDVRAVVDAKEIIEIEMQVQDQHNIDTRSATYMTKIYADQLQPNDQYTKAKKVIVINILNFNYYKRNSYHSIARMKFEESQECKKVDMGYIVEDKYATKDLEMHFIELPKFRQKSPDLSNKLDQWLWLICDEEEKIKMAKRKNEEIEKANEELEKLAMDPEEREMYELRIKAIRDEMNIRESGYTDGKADGIKIGEAKGREAGRTEGLKIGEAKGRTEGITLGENKKSIEIAKNMLKENIDVEIIAKVTGLSKEEVEKLR